MYSLINRFANIVKLYFQNRNVKIINCPTNFKTRQELDKHILDINQGLYCSKKFDKYN